MYPNIDKDDWEELVEFSINYADAITERTEIEGFFILESDSDYETIEEEQQATKLINFIKILEIKYGPHPIILDAKSNFENAIALQIKYKEQAIELCAAEDFMLRGSIKKNLAEVLFENTTDSTKPLQLIEEAIEDLRIDGFESDLLDAIEIKFRYKNAEG